MTSRPPRTGLDSWGWDREGVALLPATLRSLWAHRVLPDWVCAALGKPPDSRFASLDQGVFPEDPVLAAEVQAWLNSLLKVHRREIADLPVSRMPWPATFHLYFLLLPTRVENALRNSRIVWSEEFHHMTFRQLLAIRGIGARSVLGFLCALEEELAHFVPYDAARDASGGDTPERATERRRDTIETPAEPPSIPDEPWASQVSEADWRFRSAGGSVGRHDDPTGWKARWRLRFDDPATRWGRLADDVASVREEVARIAALPLDAALADYVAQTALIDGPRLAGLLSRLHLAGQEAPVKLDQAGAQAGVSRERMRQLQERFTARHPVGYPVVMPPLDRAIEWLEEHAPIPASDAAVALAEAGISARPFRPESVLAAARLFSRTSTVDVESVRGVAVVVAIDAVPRIHAICREADRLLAGSGISSVAAVSAMLRQRTTIDANEDAVRDTLRQYGGYRFLHGEWFWHPEGESDPVRKVLRRILSLTPEVGVASLREGIRREFKVRESHARRIGRPMTAPPVQALAVYCASHPDFEVDGRDNVRASRPLDYRSELAPIERAIVEIIRAAPGGALDRGSILAAAAARGVNSNSASLALSYSPVIEQGAADLWIIRGSRVDQSVVADLYRSRIRRSHWEMRTVGYGWADDREVWLAVRLPAAIDHFILGVPSALREVLADRDFAATTGTGGSPGHIRVAGGRRITGFIPLLRTAGAVANDVLMMRFNLATSTCALSLVSEDDVEDLVRSADPT